MSEPEYIQLEAEMQQVITPEQAWHYKIIPSLIKDNTFELFIDEDEKNNGLKDELEILFGKNIVLKPASSQVIRQTLSRYYRKVAQNKKSKATYLANYQAEDFLFKLIEEAKAINSSDIHIESYEEKSRVRLRIDGKLIERYIINKLEYPTLVNKIKIKANMDIAEKRLPQDGRIFFDTGKERFDIRVSVLPTLYGEKVVLRLLSKDTTNVDINQLGFSQEQISDYLEGTKKSHGIVLISGPTGSGKTTTLYATLKILNKEHTNILTIEDPIEYTLEGINQVQLKEAIGLNFASALRTFLRQDPDIIMLGEIRDGETAQMAIRAALTGHLVLSTVHTNSAWGTVSRLIDMGVPSFLLANTLNLTVAQRLVRMLCPHCKKEVEFNKSILPKHYLPPFEIKKHFIADGCEHCYYTGYKGRKAVYEVIPIDFELSNYIKNETFDVSDYLKQKNIRRLSEQAYTLLSTGETTIDEIYTILLSSNY
ncbi:MAG: GspE/PulE family protein [Bacteroidales bacterium]